MKQTFSAFIIANFTLPVFVSLIVYKFFEIILDKFLTPLIHTVIDPQNNLPKHKLPIGNYTLQYGEAFRYISVLFVIITLVYYLFRTK